MPRAWLPLVLSSCALLPPAALAGAEQTRQRFERTIEKHVALDYLLALPAGYDPAGPPVPLLLFLHGAGERGSDPALLLRHGPPKLVAAGRALPAMVVSPQCPADTWWTEHLDALEALLGDVMARYRVDPERVYLTGISMGGYGTWALAARLPQRFAAAAPICGGGTRILALRLRELPIWAFHGEADPVVPVEESQGMVRAIERLGGRLAKLTVYPAVGHDSWTQAYEDEALWEWLFAQKRAVPAAAQ